MTDKPTTIETAEWAKELNKLIKNDLTRHGMAIVTWGEEDFKPRTELEAELRQFISQLLQSSSLALLREVSEQVIDLYDGGLEEQEGHVSGYAQAFIEGFREAKSQMKQKTETLIKKYERK